MTKGHRSQWISGEMQKEKPTSRHCKQYRQGWVGATEDPCPLLSAGLHCRMPLGGRKRVAYKRDAKGKLKPRLDISSIPYHPHLET